MREYVDNLKNKDDLVKNSGNCLLFRSNIIKVLITGKRLKIKLQEDRFLIVKNSQNLYFSKPRSRGNKFLSFEYPSSSFDYPSSTFDYIKI